MKICICGKGGSGKSTVVKLMADAFIDYGKGVTILDSDESNANLYCMLGFDNPPRSLMDSLGGKKNVKQKMMARFSKGQNEPEMSIWEGERISVDSIPPEYVAQKGNLRLIATGKIHQALEGCACPMGVVTREFLKKLELAPDEIMLIDMEAGVEHFGRGIEANVDAVICIVDPSLESVSQAGKIMLLAQSSGASFKGAILNKVRSAEQESIISNKLNALNVPLLGTVMYHEEIEAAGLEGKPHSVPAISSEMEGIVKALLL